MHTYSGFLKERIYVLRIQRSRFCLQDTKIKILCLKNIKCLILKNNNLSWSIIRNFPHPEIGVLARLTNKPFNNSTHMNLEKLHMNHVYIVRYCASDGRGPEFSRCYSWGNRMIWKWPNDGLTEVKKSKIYQKNKSSGIGLGVFFQRRGIKINYF